VRLETVLSLENDVAAPAGNLVNFFHHLRNDTGIRCRGPDGSLATDAGAEHSISDGGYGRASRMRLNGVAFARRNL
jgi:hypothetical protein